MSIVAVNPATGEELKAYPETKTEDIGAVINAVDHAFSKWQHVPFAERAVCMQQAGKILRKRKAEFARLMAEEMGKPLAQGESEVEKCAWVCEYYAENAASFLQPESISTDATQSYVMFQPLGVILAVMPWNFPFWQVFRFVAPGLMAGNTAVLKHASNVPGCALAIEAVLREAGFPSNVFRTLMIGSRQVEDVIRHPLVRAVTLTGSTPAGMAVAATSGAVLKKCVLELGGSDPYVILEDADLDAAVKACVTSRLINSGQSCIAAKRFIVVEAVRERFTELFVEAMRERVFGDPFMPEVNVGPMARQDLRDELHEQVRKSVEMGASCLLGGEIPDRTGAFYPPTVLENVEKGMPAYDEELFGPVAAIITADSEADAIAKANDSPFGLGAAVFTSDTQRGNRIAAEELVAGCCFVNAFVKSDPRLPFGGIKTSGFGRELGVYGIKEFVNIKTVYVQ